MNSGIGFLKEMFVESKKILDDALISNNKNRFALVGDCKGKSSIRVLLGVLCIL
jgi:hypothetical protein